MLLNSFKLLFKNIKIVVPNILLSIFTFLISFVFFFTMGNNFSYSSSAFGYYPSNGVIFSSLLLAIIISAIYIFCECLTILLSIAAIDNEPLSFKNVIKRSKKYYLRLLGLFAIQFAVTFVVAFAAIALIMISTFSLMGGSNIPFVISILVIALFFVFISISFSPMPYVLVFEDSSLGYAISNGFKFAMKKFFRILGVTLLLGIIASLFSLIYIYMDSIVLEFICDLLIVCLGIVIGIYILLLYKDYLYKLNNILPEVEFTENIVDSTLIEEANISSTNNENNNSSNEDNNSSSNDIKNNEDK